jgi:hypothetical protein
MDADLDTLATKLYVKIDDALKEAPGLGPRRPKVGIAPKLSRCRTGHGGVMQARLRVHVGDSLVAVRRCPSGPLVPPACLPSRGVKQAAPGRRG